MTYYLWNTLEDLLKNVDKQTGLGPIYFMDEKWDLKLFGKWWVNDNRIYIFGWTIHFNTLKINLGNVCLELQPLRICEMQDAAGVLEHLLHVKWI